MWGQDASKLIFAKALEIAKQTVIASEARATPPVNAAAIKEEKDVARHEPGWSDAQYVA